MMKLLLVVLAVPLAAARAQSPLDGTCKADLGKLKFPTKTDVIELKNGRYKCATRVPAPMKQVRFRNLKVHPNRVALEQLKSGSTSTRSARKSTPPR